MAPAGFSCHEGAPAEFTFRDGERLIRFGPGVADEALELIEQWGLGGYALLSTERALGSAPWGLVDAAEVVLEVPAGPVPDVAAAVRDAVGGRPIVALGGGRVVDAAKAIAGADGLTCAAIPTSLAGSPFTPFHRMPAGVHEPSLVRPALAVCDPDLMASAPLPLLAATTLNALAHAVESLYAPGANPVAEGAALRGISLLGSGLRAQPPGAEDLARGAVLAGWAVGIAGFAVHHAVCQTIVRTAGTAHAQTNAAMLPHTVDFMAERAPDAIAAVAGALGQGGVRAAGEPQDVAARPEPASAAERVAALAALADAGTLAELGVGSVDLASLAAAVMDHPAIGVTPGGVTEAQVLELLERAL